MKRFTIIAFFCFSSVFMWAQTNPIADLYNTAEGYPSWTDDIKWDNIITMTNKGTGAANFADFKEKRDLLFAQGGGVLYYPAGTYQFDVADGPSGEGLMLKSGVVILGQAPTTDKWAVTTRDITTLSQHGLTSNPTKFVFSRIDYSADLTSLTNGPAMVPKMWNMIGCTPSTAHHVGVAWIEMEYGFIFFGFGSDNWGASYETAGAWLSAKLYNTWGTRVPDGTYPMDMTCGLPPGSHAVMGEKRFVFGVHLKNATNSNYAINKPSLLNFKIDNGSWRFGARIGVNGRDVFVANNCISKPDTSAVFRYLAPYLTGTSITIYDPAKSGGIDVNKSHMSHFYNKCAVDDSNSFYTTNVLIRDNWVYNHAGKGIEFSGNWVKVLGNVNWRQPYEKNDVYGTGADLPCVIAASDGKCYTSENAYDFMSRFMDYGGSNIWVHNNRWEGTGSLGNDGEGILCQRHTGIESYSVALTYNKQGAAGEAGYIAPYDVHYIGLFHGWNAIRGSTGLLKTAENWGADLSTIQNTFINGSANEPGLISGINIKDFYKATCPNGTTPGKPTITLKQAVDNIEISWSNVSGEVAYRIERRKEGESDWTVVAYRPRQETGGNVTFEFGDRSLGNIAISANYLTYDTALCWDGATRNMNPAKWKDYTSVAGVSHYRVVAVGCNDAGTISEQDSVMVNKNEVASDIITIAQVKVYPNPATDYVKIAPAINSDDKYVVYIYSMAGVLLDVVNNSYGSEILYPITGLASGKYIVNLKTESGVMGFSSFLKK